MKRLMILSGPNLNLLGVSKISSVASGVICGFIAAMHALARMAKKS
jgi:3-dehydroquinate dehydratase